MSAANFLTDWHRCTELYEKEIAVNYTTTSGSSYWYNPVITVVSPAASITVTVTDGVFVGQYCIVRYKTLTTSMTVTVSANSGTIATLSIAGDYTYLMWMGTDWVEIKSLEAGA